MEWAHSKELKRLGNTHVSNEEHRADTHTEAYSERFSTNCRDPTDCGREM